MEVQSPSPTASTYDYVYDKDSDQYVLDRPQDAALTRLHWVVLANLVLLFIFCFITILTSGLVFGHSVASSDCLGQSWVMFSVRHISQHQPPRRQLLATTPHHTTPPCMNSRPDNKRLHPACCTPDAVPREPREKTLAR